MKNRNPKEQKIILLAQPYEKVFSENLFEKLLVDCKNWALSQDNGKIYVKLHPSTPNIYDKYYKPGFTKFVSRGALAIEAYGALFSNDDIIVSHNSSALITLRYFGFEGRRVSFGLQAVCKQYKERPRMLADYRKVFRENGVEMYD